MPATPPSYLLWIGAGSQSEAPPAAVCALLASPPTQRVSSLEGLEAALEGQPPSLCLITAPPPELSELELLERLEAKWPDSPILLASSVERTAGRLRTLKKEAMRSLAAGVAHDLNNMLGVIESYVSVLRDELPNSDPRQTDTLEILGACARARATTDQMLAFSRRRPVSPERVDLSVHLAKRQEMLARQVGEGVTWSLQLEPGLVVFVDPSRLDEALLQLVLNANDAMPRGGRLELSARRSERAGLMVCLSLADDGVGMEPEVRARIFEPFYSHRRGGKGRGLGLSIVEGFVAGAGGAVELESAPARGTRVSLFLPLVEPGPLTPAG